MKTTLLIYLGLFSSFAFSSSSNFPTGPNSDLTPGKLCEKTLVYHFPEHIAYCVRDVTPETKNQLIAKYDSLLGFHIQKMNREEFKVDHFIPLCAGGSNDISNLWPQHKSVYELTDPIEPLLCDKMAAGKLRQADAVKLIKQAKNHLDQVDDVMRILSSL